MLVDCFYGSYIYVIVVWSFFCLYQILKAFYKDRESNMWSIWLRSLKRNQKSADISFLWQLYNISNRSGLTYLQLATIRSNRRTGRHSHVLEFFNDYWYWSRIYILFVWSCRCILFLCALQTSWQNECIHCRGIMRHNNTIYKTNWINLKSINNIAYYFKDASNYKNFKLQITKYKLQITSH